MAVGGPRSKFLKVKCQDCGNQQIIFDRASSLVTCFACGATLARPTGGKVAIKGEILGEME